MVRAQASVYPILCLTERTVTPCSRSSSTTRSLHGTPPSTSLTVRSQHWLNRRDSESCIKGHRSSVCQHTERPLYEVRKKGRPVSQCDKCRELRKTKRAHNRCTCASGSAATARLSPVAINAAQSSEAAGKQKGAWNPVCRCPWVSLVRAARRFKPIAPALPNGLRDIPQEEQGNASGKAPSKETHFCQCGGNTAAACTCTNKNAPLRARLRGNLATNGLAALAQAAIVMGSSTETVPPKAPLDARIGTSSSSSSTRAGLERMQSLVPEGSSSCPPSLARRRSSTIGHQSHQHLDTPRYAGLAFSAPPAPVFPPVISLSAVTSAVDTCYCGMQCACPGCLVHRGPQHASRVHKDCTAGECATCVDHDGGTALPERALAYSQGGRASLAAVAPPLSSRAGPTTADAPSPNSKSVLSAFSPSTPGPSRRRQSTNGLDAFFAAAAALPAPPPGRSGTLDPTDVRVYPRALFGRGAADAGARRERFGLVEVPKLQCSCPGGCGCPEGRCACGKGCTGCAASQVEEGAAVDEGGVEADARATSERLVPVVGPRPCCG